MDAWKETRARIAADSESTVFPMPRRGESIRGRVRSAAGETDREAKGSENGTALIAGNRTESLFFQHAASGEMPPLDEIRLSSEEVEIIGRWSLQPCFGQIRNR